MFVASGVVDRVEGRSDLFMRDDLGTAQLRASLGTKQNESAVRQRTQSTPTACVALSNIDYLRRWLGAVQVVDALDPLVDLRWVLVSIFD